MMTQKGFSPILILLLVVIIGIAGLRGFYLGTKHRDNLSVDSLQEEVTQPDQEENLSEDMEDPVATAPTIPVAGVFKKRLFDSSKKFFNTQDYPASLLKISDSDLLGVNCSPVYSFDSQENSYFYYEGEPGASNRVKPDSTIDNLIKKASQLAGEDIYDFTICKVEDGRSFVIFSKALKGGGVGRDTYLGKVVSNGGIEKVTVIPAKNWPYYGCISPLQLSKIDMFSISCGGGDGGFGGSEIFDVNLSNGDLKLLISCTTLFDEKTNEAKVACK